MAIETLQKPVLKKPALADALIAPAEGSPPTQLELELAAKNGEKSPWWQGKATAAATDMSLAGTPQHTAEVRKELAAAGKVDVPIQLERDGQPAPTAAPTAPPPVVPVAAKPAPEKPAEQPALAQAEGAAPVIDWAAKGREIDARMAQREMLEAMRGAGPQQVGLDPETKQQMLAQIVAPIKGARGLTASQRKGITEVEQMDQQAQQANQRTAQQQQQAALQAAVSLHNAAMGQQMTQYQRESLEAQRDNNKALREQAAAQAKYTAYKDGLTEERSNRNEIKETLKNAATGADGKVDGEKLAMLERAASAVDDKSLPADVRAQTKLTNALTTNRLNELGQHWFTPEKAQDGLSVPRWQKDSAGLGDVFRGYFGGNVYRDANTGQVVSESEIDRLPESLKQGFYQQLKMYEKKPATAAK